MSARRGGPLLEHRFEVRAASQYPTGALLGALSDLPGPYWKTAPTSERPLSTLLGHRYDVSAPCQYPTGRPLGALSTLSGPYWKTISSSKREPDPLKHIGEGQEMTKGLRQVIPPNCDDLTGHVPGS